VSNKTWADDSPYRHKDEQIPEEVRPQRGKKNTRKWCKGKEGREHKPETVRSTFYNGPLFEKKDCHFVTHHVIKNGERVPLPPRWVCYHDVRCTECGKVLESFLPMEKCPTYQREHGGSTD